MWLLKNNLGSKQDVVEIIWKLLLIAFPYFLIFSLKISNGIIILLSVTALAGAIRQKQLARIKIRGLLWCSSLFLLSLFAASYAANFKLASLILDSRLPLILLPITFSLKYPSKQDLRLLLKHFNWALILTFFVCLAIALYRNYLDPWGGVWFNQWYYHYTDFTEWIDIHPLYLSLYVAFALLILVMDLVGINAISGTGKAKKITVVSLYTVFLVMLGSRWVIIVLLLTMVMILFFARREISGKWMIGFFGFVAIIAFLTILSPVTRQRFISTFTVKYEFSSYSLDRLIIWTVALDYVKKHPEEFIFGHGTGNSDQLMDNLYKERNITWDFDQKINTHNQYLDFLLNTGIIGVGWVLFFLLLSLRKFLRGKEWIGVAFVLLISLGFIGENYLNRQKGIAFIAFTYCILFLKRDDQKDEAQGMAKI